MLACAGKNRRCVPRTVVPAASFSISRRGRLRPNPAKTPLSVYLSIDRLRPFMLVWRKVKRIRQFVELPGRDRRLLLRAVALVAAVRLALWTLPFRWVRWVVDSKRSVSKELAAMRVPRLAWAVQAAARRIPGASCLTQALVLHRLMAAAGHDAGVHIGVSNDPVRGFEAHAWVEHRDEVILGDNGELERYTPLLAMCPEES